MGNRRSEIQPNSLREGQRERHQPSSSRGRIVSLKPLFFDFVELYSGLLRVFGASGLFVISGRRCLVVWSFARLLTRSTCDSNPTPTCKSGDVPSVPFEKPMPAFGGFAQAPGNQIDKSSNVRPHKAATHCAYVVVVSLTGAKHVAVAEEHAPREHRTRWGNERTGGVSRTRPVIAFRWAGRLCATALPSIIGAIHSAA